MYDELSFEFSIVVPTFNRARIISNTIDSLARINFESFEIIVVDDGSSDDTAKIVSELKIERLNYYRIDNRERGAARNYGAIRSKGKYINFFDSDDLALPNHLSVASATIDDLGSPPWFHLAYSIADEKGRPIKTCRITDIGPHNRYLAKGNVLGTNSVFLRRDVALCNPFFEDPLMAASEDYELWLRLASQYPLYGSTEVTSLLVQHSGRSVVTTNALQLIRRMSILRERILSSDSIRSHFGSSCDEIIMGLMLYTALHLSELDGTKRLALRYLWSSIFCSLSCFMSRSFYATLRNLLLR